MLYYIVLYYIVLYFLGFHHPASLTPPDPGSLPSITKDFGSRMWALEMIEFVPESMVGSKAW
jgi:hypothetical protein